MKRMLLSVVFVALFVGGMSAQTADAKRSVLFTLGENEEVAYGEYFVMQKVDKNRFACVIRNTVTDIYTLIFNGKRVAEYDNWDLIDIHYLNVHEENGYVVNYSLQGRGYVNIRGKVVGPFDYLERWGEGNKFSYYKKEGDKRKCYVHSNGVVEGPFDRVDFPSETGAYADCEYLYVLANKWYAHYRNGRNKMMQRVYSETYQRDGKWYVKINGKESRGYDAVRHMSITESGKYAYTYRNENGKWHVNINGEGSGGYDNVGGLRLTESGKYAYKYQENGKWHVNINGEGSGGYDNVGNLRLTESGKYAYTYRNENGKWHININGEESRGFDDIDHYRINVTESGKYAYGYQENEIWYVNINGEESRGYDLSVGDNGDFSFYYDGDDGKLYRNNNGEKSETEYLSGMRLYNEFAPFGNTHRPIYDSENIEIYSTDREHTLYSSYQYENVVVDGRLFGKAPALYAWYDKGKNAFVWNAVEGRELVLYEYGF